LNQSGFLLFLAIMHLLNVAWNCRRGLFVVSYSGYNSVNGGERGG